jgi:hypothetical protein
MRLTYPASGETALDYSADGKRGPAAPGGPGPPLALVEARTESCSALRLLPACADTRSRETAISSATAKPRTEIALRSHNRAPAQSPEADLALTNSAPRSNDPSIIRRWHRGYQMAQASRLVAVPNGKVRRPSSRGGLRCAARHVAHAQSVPKGDPSTVHVPAQLG